MKYDELKPLVFSLNDMAYVDERAIEKNFENPHDHAVYKATEVDALLAALKEGAKITPMGALRRFGCFRLSARIADIRKMGYKVKTRIVSRNRKNYAEYYLEAN